MGSCERAAAGKIFDIQGYSVHDGPGIRTTVFMKGCPLRCLWCHSPESQKTYEQLGWVALRCVGLDDCGLCVSACPRGAIGVGETVFSRNQNKDIRRAAVDRSLCNDCGECAQACPAQALTMIGRDYTVEQVLERIMKDVHSFNRSGGGVTISGGEPMMQFDFLYELVKILKREELHICLDTSGYAPWENYERVMPYIDLFLYDLKHMDTGRSLEYVGVRNRRIIGNALKIAHAGGKFQIRIPVIPQFNDSLENLKRSAELCVKLGEAVDVVQLLPYHKLGTTKHQRLQQKDPMPDVPAPDTRAMEMYKRLMESYGLRAMVH